MRNEVAAAHSRRDYILSNYFEEAGPLETPCWIWQRYSDPGYNSLVCDQWLDKPLNVIPGIHD
jgi:hypothetical protein